MTLFVDPTTSVDSFSSAQRRSREQDPSQTSPSYTQDGSQSPSNFDDSPKKRKRSRKSHLEKKFECKHESCGKTYSRAEHLYRHQLNHAPKQIYRCEFPNCYRSFVRQDLCIRHQERHTTHGSQLQKRDNVATQTSLTAASQRSRKGSIISAHGTTSALSPTDGIGSPGAISRAHFTDPSFINTNNLTMNPQGYLPSNASSSSTPVDNEYHSPKPHPSCPDAHMKTSDGGAMYTVPSQKAQSSMLYAHTNHQPYETYDGQPYQNMAFSRPDMASSAPNPSATMRPRHISIPETPNHATNQYMCSNGIVNDTGAPNNYLSQQHNLHLSSLSSPSFSDPNLTAANNASIANAISNGLGNLDPVAGVIPPDTSVSDLDSMAPYALPVFGGETLNRSPFAMTEDFTSWLFNESPNASSSIGYPAVSGMMSGYSDPFSGQMQNQYYPTESSFGRYFANAMQQHPMSVTSILDSGPPHSVISEGKRNELLDLIQTRFKETDHATVTKRKEALMGGNMDSDSHILSLRMMQTYIRSYWHNCHDQLPILHKPTFTADKTPNLLLLAVMAIGASILDKDHGQHTTDMASELANFICWHLRWEVFRDSDFRPPARLWVFQTLLLLETYEKLYSTRELHERAHIHHDTTLTLMRRGSSLIGRSAFDSPTSIGEDRQNRSATGSGTNSATEIGAGDDSWTRWIKAEATRRVAFAAFVLDSTHATMFGHSVKMVAHEMRLPLPCDEALWSATSAAEVSRVQSSLNSNGVKPTMFLDGLKKTLNGQRVRTNSFGRTIIMAGLLSVSWHMNQRDLQVSSLGVSQALGGRGKWRSAMLRAFDNWKRDFDEALVEANQSNCSSGYRQQNPFDNDVFFETRNVLHHLAHMTSHVDVVDCQIFAGADRLLGRSITPRDYSNAREKMTERWATKASARDATFYALKFLSQVLTSDESQTGRRESVASINLSDYSARDDVLMNRPWVLYFSALVVWCYGYALDGPIIPYPTLDLSDPLHQRQDMYAFLARVGGVRSPDDLDKIRDRNRCMGLLMVLRDSFNHTRWELLHEAANLLGSCIEKLKGPTMTAAGS